MAMRLFRAAEFEKQLAKRGCSKIRELPGGAGTLWRKPEGKAFQVPSPEEWVEASEAEPAFPDFILDDLIETHGLPKDLIA